MKKKKMQTWVSVLGIAFIVGAPIAVSLPPEVSAGTPCCTVTTVNVKTGIVTAKNTATGETFKFRLVEAAQIGNIKVGDQVSTDFQTRQVTVHSFQPAEGILMRTPRPRPPIK
jgi:hypothetical protein